jgi:prevent-host-death family protein
MTTFVMPVTDFRKEAKAVLEKLQETAVILTQRSRPVAVLVDYTNYREQQKRLEELELLLDDYALNQAIDTATEFVTLDDLFAEVISSKEEAAG